jgi:hypothetical protein
MNKQIFICILVFVSACSIHAQTKDIAMNNLSGPEEVNLYNKGYVYEVYDSISSSKSVFEEEHFLGGKLSEKWNSFNQNFTRVFDVKIGLSKSAVEIQKPSVYNAVIKVNNYYKKAVRKGTISKDEAEHKLSHIFDCANVICFSYNTSDFENAVKNVKSPEDIISLFDKVVIKVVN